jgi:hypothetical protein
MRHSPNARKWLGPIHWVLPPLVVVGTVMIYRLLGPVLHKLARTLRYLPVRGPLPLFAWKSSLTLWLIHVSTKITPVLSLMCQHLFTPTLPEPPSLIFIHNNFDWPIAVILVKINFCHVVLLCLIALIVRKVSHVFIVRSCILFYWFVNLFWSGNNLFVIRIFFLVLRHHCSSWLFPSLLPDFPSTFTR